MRMRKKNFLAGMVVVGCLSLSFVGCSNTTSTKEKGEPATLTPSQKELVQSGWYAPERMPEGELSKDYGVKNVYGQQDNYFDIKIGEGCDVAIKIVDVQSGKCVRYVLVPENESITINQIPQGKYYLKLAYGKDWMEKVSDNCIVGKFSRNALYERSVDVFDFGKKNSNQIVNYALSINVVDDSSENNFSTCDISEDEFLNE